MENFKERLEKGIPVEQMIWFTEEDLQQHDKAIRQEAIMEVIDEIPDSVDFSNPDMGKTHIKDQLKSKFANKI